MSRKKFYKGQAMRSQLNGQIFRKSQFYMLQAMDFQASILSKIARAAELL